MRAPDGGVRGQGGQGKGWRLRGPLMHLTADGSWAHLYKEREKRIHTGTVLQDESSRGPVYSQEHSLTLILCTSDGNGRGRVRERERERERESERESERKRQRRGEEEGDMESWKVIAGVNVSVRV